MLVIIPTYNELGNLPLIVKRLFDAVPAANLMIVDDGSPDGTGVLADAIAAEDARVFVTHRSGKLGLGSAYIAGFRWGLERGYEFLVEMDADGSHPPETLPAMIAMMAPADGDVAPGLVIGSRWVRGGSVVGWPRRREALSRVANLYSRLVLGLPVRDSTAGFRVYAAATLRSLNLGTVASKGYCFQIDMTLRVLDAGLEVFEAPITFRERQIGQSKMSGEIVYEAMARVTLWGFQRRFGRASRGIPTQ